ncbi:hypothetical protein DFP90_101271 [Aestuariispira insulae]|uniref:Uncharacterized protein n=1 Tax=Aestuariispira insulae TaxID=1461337 RepID=A0A3D9HVG3_9PROT|nr:hypothetical protein DFP90_101271 [Aestuariispira insulae]
MKFSTLMVIVTSIVVSNSATAGPKTVETKVGTIAVENDSATMFAEKDWFVTVSTGPVGKTGIPARIRLGDVISVKDRSLTANHIIATRYLETLTWKGEVLARAGDTSCIVVEKLTDIPSDDARDRLWIHVKQCKVVSD